MSKKPVIVFEGIEGSGKSHHISNVSKNLEKKKSTLLNYESLEVTLTQKRLEH